MLFFSKLKQKIAKTRITPSQKNFLVVFSVTCLFICFYPHNANALGIGDSLVGAFVWLLKAILKFVALLLSVAETLFQWVVNPDNMLKVMDNPVVYATWTTVRDTFNVVFIMVLLFSAFATIFQASTSYNYKKLLLNLVIMALLVNFSYPISRLIIDASNIIMFGFLNNLGGSSSLLNVIDKSGLADIFGAATADPLYLISAIIFTFILAITLLVIAVLLVIRTITLTIYIIFSPIAFVGKIAPGTALASASSDWWKEFMKQCFAGPTIVFMLFVATQMFSAITTMGGDFSNIATKQVPGFNPNSQENSALGTLITSASFFALPIIILWYGIILAQKSGIVGANAVVGYGKKAMKWAGSAPHRSAWWAAKKTGVPGGIQQKWANFKKSGPLGSDRQAEREARFAGKGPFAIKGSAEKDMRRRSDEYKKNLTTEAELKSLAATGDAAAALRLAEDKKMDQITYDNFTRTNTNSALRGVINAKVKQNRNDLVAINKSNDAAEQAKAENISGASAASAASIAAGGPAISVSQYIANQQMGHLSADQWNDQDWTAITNPLPPGANATQIANRTRAITAIQTAWTNLKPEAQLEVRKRLSGNNSSALRSIGIV